MMLHTWCFVCEVFLFLCCVSRWSQLTACGCSPGCCVCVCVCFRWSFDSYLAWLYSRCVLYAAQPSSRGLLVVGGVCCQCRSVGCWFVGRCFYLLSGYAVHRLQAWLCRLQCLKSVFATCSVNLHRSAVVCVAIQLLVVFVCCVCALDKHLCRREL